MLAASGMSCNRYSTTKNWLPHFGYSKYPQATFPGKNYYLEKNINKKSNNYIGCCSN